MHVMLTKHLIAFILAGVLSVSSELQTKRRKKEENMSGKLSTGIALEKKDSSSYHSMD